MRKAITRMVAVLFLLTMGAALLFAGAEAEKKDSAAAGAAQAVSIRVWDHFQPLTKAHDAIIERMKVNNPGLTVEHTIYNPATMSEALQLAFQSGQLPDITTNITGIPARRLIAQGWYVPIDEYVDVKQNALVAQNLFEGLTVFDGRVYSVPIFNRRWTESANWVNKDLMSSYGIDIDRDLATYDAALRASRTIRERSGGKDSGIVLPIQFTGRMGSILTMLAMGNGAPGAIDWHTGAYQYDSEPYVQALEFLYTFQRERTLFPASISLDARNARARWAAGGIGMFFDGPWNIGALYTAYPEAVSIADVTWMPVAKADSPARAYVSPPVGEFFLTGQGNNKAIAAQFFLGLTSEQYYIDLAKGQDQPPLDMSAIAKADVHPSYIKVNELYAEHVRIAPVPEIRNPAVAEVVTEMRQVQPDLGSIIQGVFSGAIPDMRAALREYNQAMTAERDRAIGVVVGRGVAVSREDWVFSNWDRSRDFTPEMYQAAKR